MSEDREKYILDGTDPGRGRKMKTIKRIMFWVLAFALVAPGIGLLTGGARSAFDYAFAVILIGGALVFGYHAAHKTRTEVS